MVMWRTQRKRFTDGGLQPGSDKLTTKMNLALCNRPLTAYASTLFDGELFSGRAHQQAPDAAQRLVDLKRVGQEPGAEISWIIHSKRHLTLRPNLSQRRQKLWLVVECASKTCHLYKAAGRLAASSEPLHRKTSEGL